MKSLDINLTSNNYNIIIERDIFKNIGVEIKKIYKGSKIAIVTDKNLYALYGNKLKDILHYENYNISFIVVEPGEMSKSMENLTYIYTKLIEFGVTRNDLILAFGGGVIGDLAGFASSTYLRGIDYIQVPTTLLSQIDSSIGGKVAINLPQGKNLAGSFYHPKKIIIDPNFLNSLPNKFIKDGLGEVIKYACLKNNSFFNKLLTIKSKTYFFEDIENTIYICCNIKKEIIEKDEKDCNIRMILNFGHTLGHAIEKYYNYERYTHGEAVSLGMYYITQKSETHGYTQLGTANKIKEILLNYNIDYNFPKVNMSEIIKIIHLDKKNNSGNINLILLNKIGDSFIKKLPIENLERFLI